MEPRVKLVLINAAITIGLIAAAAGIILLARGDAQAAKRHSDWIQEQRANGPDAVARRQAHGIPIFSDWDGHSVIDCKPLPRPEGK